ncbi:hypothetical protein QBC44DRAFT_366788 [Cladorrhinum sp. PSN332]|nr:hypothetical protein QBC44DRAFT_366788 [Cladorrhinum sp. PSN332]
MHSQLRLSAAATAALLLLAGGAAASPAPGPAPPLITPGPDVNHLLFLARRQETETQSPDAADSLSSACHASSVSLFRDQPLPANTLIDWFNSDMARLRTQTRSRTTVPGPATTDYSSLCSLRPEATAAAVTAHGYDFDTPELSSAWTSYLFASASWVSRSDVQSIGKAVVESCTGQLGDYDRGTILMQIHTDVPGCVSAFELVAAGRASATPTPTPTGNGNGGEAVSSTLSTGGMARETACVRVVAAVAAVAAAAGAVGAMGI